jgi:hypothetical protein
MEEGRSLMKVGNRISFGIRYRKRNRFTPGVRDESWSRLAAGPGLKIAIDIVGKSFVGEWRKCSGADCPLCSTRNNEC